MTIPSVIRVTSTEYYVAQAAAAAALGVPEGVTDWSWEGGGLSGHLLALIPDTEDTVNMPTGFTRLRTRERIFEFQDIYDLIFEPQGFPASLFTDVHISPGDVAGTPVLLFNLGTRSEAPGAS